MPSNTKGPIAAYARRLYHIYWGTKSKRNLEGIRLIPGKIGADANTRRGITGALWRTLIVRRKRWQMDRRQTLLATSLPLAGLLGVAFLLDLLFAASLSPLFLGVVATVGIVAAGAIAVGARRAECLMPLHPFAAMLALLPLIDTSPLKPFGRFYLAIKPGMTEVEVIRALDDQFPPTGRYPRPLVNRLVGPNHVGFILARGTGGTTQR